MRAHIQAARGCGAEVLRNTKVAGWEVVGDGGAATVWDSSGTQHVAHQVVLCVGAWSNQLVPELKGYLQPERQVVAWFEVLPLCVCACDKVDSKRHRHRSAAQERARGHRNKAHTSVNVQKGIPREIPLCVCVGYID